MTLSELRARYGDSFSAFWRVYPRREQMAQAERAFYSAIQDGYDPIQIITKAKAFARNQNPDELRFVPSPNKWLADRRWEDNDLFTDQRLAEKEWLNGCWDRVDVKAVEARFQIKMPRINVPDGMEADDIPAWYKSQARLWIRETSRKMLEDSD